MPDSLGPQDSFGQRIVAARREAGLTQTQLAAAVGVREDTVASWEAGRRQPRVVHVRALARALGITAGRLVDDEPTGVPA